MHFLSHYYTEPTPPLPLQTIGLILPDLTHGFSKIYNRFISRDKAPAHTPLKQIYYGIQQHYAADKWFHASPLFNEKVKQATVFFLQAGLNRERLRLSVIAHLAVEMLIDRQIVLQYPEICNRFYEEVNTADEEHIAAYFDSLKQPLAKQQFFHTFKFFKQRRFLFLFAELKHLLFGLNKVYSNVTGTEFTAEEKLRFLTALHNIDLEMRYSWQQILKR